MDHLATRFISGEAPKAEMALILFLVLALLIVADGAAYFWYMARDPEDSSLAELIRRDLSNARELKRPRLSSSEGDAL